MKMSISTLRRSFLSLLTALHLLFAACPVQAADLRPSIVLFMADNWAWPHAGILGDPTAKTPVFDRIAREGVLFRHAFCPVPSCSPTRSCILTGRPAHQLEDAASLWSAFPGDLNVFTETLRQAGYQVGYSGKGWSPGRYTEFGWKTNPVGERYTDFAEFLMKRDLARPFFFWRGNVDTSKNNWKFEPDGWEGLNPSSVRVPPMLPDTDDVRRSMMGYYGGVSRIDADAGQHVRLLENAGLMDSTLFIYTSDNGWQMPRGLANCYDTGVRIPMAVRWGRRLQAGMTVDDFVSLTDLGPTILRAAGLPPHSDMTGVSFLDLLLNQPDAVHRDHVFLERERHANVRRGNLSYPIRAIRNRDFLYIRNLRPDRWPAGDPKAWFAVGDFGDVDDTPAKLQISQHADDPAIARYFQLSFAKRPAEELYDLRSDPDQLVNVADQPQYAAARQQLSDQVTRWMVETSDPRTDPNDDRWDKFAYYGNRVVDEHGQPLKRPDKVLREK
ncbi:MAG: sulfatase [Planctomycetaceae bacterium]